MAGGGAKTTRAAGPPAVRAVWRAVQAQGISPGPVEATVTITDQHGRLIGQLDLDVGDAQFMLGAISGMLNLTYGPGKSQGADRPLAGYRAGPPG